VPRPFCGLSQQTAPPITNNNPQNLLSIDPCSLNNTQEDAHIALLDVDNHQNALFSVFDGHGGKAVAKYAAKHMVRFCSE